MHAYAFVCACARVARSIGDHSRCSQFLHRESTWLGPDSASKGIVITIITTIITMNIIGNHGQLLLQRAEPFQEREDPGHSAS